MEKHCPNIGRAPYWCLPVLVAALLVRICLESVKMLEKYVKTLETSMNMLECSVNTLVTAARKTATNKGKVNAGALRRCSSSSESDCA